MYCTGIDSIIHSIVIRLRYTSRVPLVLRELLAFAAVGAGRPAPAIEAFAAAALVRLVLPVPFEVFTPPRVATI